MNHTIPIYFGLIFFSIILFNYSNSSTVRNTEIAKKTEPIQFQLNEKYNSATILVEKNQPNQKSELFAFEEDTVKGNFNGDDKIDLMWLDKPKITNNGIDCIGNCNSFIQFSDKAIPPILVKDCISGLPDNLGDLNKNGTDEIGLLPGWFSSCWRAYFVWTYLNGNWEFAVEPFMTYCNQWDDNVKPIEIDKNKVGYVIIRYTGLTEEPDFDVKLKSVKIKK